MEIRIGLNGLCVSELIKDESAVSSSDGTASVEYGEIKRLKDVQNINLTARVQTSNIDADDVTHVLNMCTGYDGSAQRTMFSPEEQAMLLGEKIVDGMVMSTDNDAPPEYAVGFRSSLSDGGTLVMWLLRTQFSAGDFTGETKGNETLNPQSDKLSFKSMPRSADGAWRFYKVVKTDDEIGSFFSVDTLKKLASAAKADGGTV